MSELAQKWGRGWLSLGDELRQELAMAALFGRFVSRHYEGREGGTASELTEEMQTLQRAVMRLLS